jgi:glycerophosphoryl diester phosphodiesterase
VSTRAAFTVSRPIAHRGLHDAAQGIIENTRSAFAAAIARGFAIECDIQLTRDGEAVVFHDFTADRLTSGTGKLSEMTAGAVQALPFRAGQNHMETLGGRIETLAALLAQVAGRVPLVVEIKSHMEGDLRLTRRALEVAAGYAGPLAFKSFDPNIVAALRMMAPDVVRGIVAISRYDHPEWNQISAAQKHAMANLLHFGETQPDFISWHVNDLPLAAPFLCRTALGLPLMTWTVRTAEQREIARQHADQMVFEGFIPSA